MQGNITVSQVPQGKAFPTGTGKAAIEQLDPAD